MHRYILLCCASGGLVANGYTDLTKLASQSVSPEDGESTVDLLKRKGQEAIETVSGTRQQAEQGNVKREEEDPSSFSGHDDFEQILHRDSHPKSEQTGGTLSDAVGRAQELGSSAADDLKTSLLGADAKA